jgi:MFS family permease
MVEKKAATAKPDREKVGVGRLLGIVGGVLTFVGALLPWVTLPGYGTSPPETYLGVTSGFVGVLVSQLGFFGILMMIDGKKTTSIGGMAMGIFGAILSALPLLAVGFLTAVGDTTGLAVEMNFGIYVCIVGSIILMVGSIMALIGAGKPLEFPIPPAKPAKKGKPIEAMVTFIATLAGAVLLLAYPWTLGNVDALGAVLFLFGLILLPTSYYLFKVEYWSWGTVLIVLILVLLFAIPSSTLVLVGYADALAMILYFTRLTYGVGVWKIDLAREKEQRKAREVVRTANPEGLHCPRCRSTDIYICDDGSSYCRSCNSGFVDIHDVSARPKSSMQT